MKKIVTIGGGSGLATLLRGIRDYPMEISAIVTMTDDGASTGRLRKDLKVLPPGDIRKCIAALSHEEGALLPLFEHRFKKGFGLSGHSFGNLFLTALIEMTGSFEEAVLLASKILQTQGVIIPSTLNDVHLVASFNNKKIIGESKITKYGYNHKIIKMSLSKKAKANPEAVEAIKKADVLVVGPGSLFTSIIPNFLLPGILNEYSRSKALKIYIANVSTERGETENYNLSNHLDALSDYGIKFDIIVANNKKFKINPKEKHVKPVEIDRDYFIETKVVKEDIYNTRNPLYHDSEKLGDLIYDISNNRKKYLR